jgi:hypothetical protein
MDDHMCAVTSTTVSRVGAKGGAERERPCLMGQLHEVLNSGFGDGKAPPPRAIRGLGAHAGG